MHKNGIYEKHFKRPFDFIIALITLIIFSPFLLLISLLVWTKLGRPIIFRQKRPGFNGKIFTLYKFRTMNNKTDENDELLPDKDRLTKFGKFLRATSLDELPELINIIKGEMSIVGPRPQLIKDLVFISKEFNKRHLVRPGLTGLAQSSGRNNIAWEEKFKLDIIYIKNITFLRDLAIIIKTVFSILKSEGISTNGMATSEDYGDYLLRTGKINDSIYFKNLDKINKITSDNYYNIEK